MTPKRAPRAGEIRQMARETAVRVVPPLIVLALLMLFWNWCAGAPARPCAAVEGFQGYQELIFDPFFDHGGTTRACSGICLPACSGWRLAISLAAIVGVALGTLVGQSVWAMRGLDPRSRCCYDSPLAWLPLALAAFRTASLRLFS